MIWCLLEVFGESLIHQLILGTKTSWIPKVHSFVYKVLSLLCPRLCLLSVGAAVDQGLVLPPWQSLCSPTSGWGIETRVGIRMLPLSSSVSPGKASHMSDPQCCFFMRQTEQYRLRVEHLMRCRMWHGVSCMIVVMFIISWQNATSWKYSGGSMLVFSCGKLRHHNKHIPALYILHVFPI